MWSIREVLAGVKQELNLLRVRASFRTNLTEETPWNPINVQQLQDPDLMPRLNSGRIVRHQLTTVRT